MPREGAGEGRSVCVREGERETERARRQRKEHRGSACGEQGKHSSAAGSENERLSRRQNAPYAAITAVRVGEYASGFRCCAIMSAIPMIDPAVSAFVRIGETTNALLYRRHASVSTVPALTATSSTTMVRTGRKCARLSRE